MDERLQAFQRLLDIMDELREQCPWDRKQTWETLRPLTIEETYELADAILDNDPKAIEEELGDLIMHITFYARIGREKEAFDITSLIHRVCDKLVHRHPHIYGEDKAATAEEVKDNWEKIKLKEGKKSVLEGVPTSLPAMIKATRIQQKARQVGFDWDNEQQVWEKVKEELEEFKEEEQKGDPSLIESEFGDLLFSLINYARFVDIDPETALERTNKKFIQRFQYLETQARENGKELKKMTLEEMEAIWQKAKGG